MSFNILEKYLVTVSPSSFSVLICIRGPWPIITSLLPNLLTLKRPAHAFSGSCMRYRIKGRGIKRQPMIKMHEMQLPFKYLSLSLHSASFLLSSTLSFINPVIKIISYLHSAACTPHYFLFFYHDFFGRVGIWSVSSHPFTLPQFCINLPTHEGTCSL